jgi:hypothetical protein
MAYVTWINQQFLKTITPISINVDVNEVANHIYTAQLINIRELLGKNLYEDLNTKFVSGTFSAIEEELFDILKQALAYRATWCAIPFLGIKIRSKGVVRLNDEFSQSASLDDLKYLRNELDNRSQYFENRAQEFLCQFSVDFPLYLNDTSPRNQIYPTSNNFYESDIYIDSRDREILRRNRYLYGPNSSEPGNTY